MTTEEEKTLIKLFGKPETEKERRKTRRPTTQELTRLAEAVRKGAI